MPRLSVYIAASIDGFIAAPDGSLDWLDDAADSSEDYGYDTFMSSVDALAMGRGTYDHIQHIDPLPFGDRPVYVFTSHPSRPRTGVSLWDCDPRTAAQRWDEAGHQRVYVDGGRLISAFLAEGLIDDMVLTTAPVVLGSGRSLFHEGAPRSAWELTDVESWPSGMVNRHYRRLP